MKGLKLIPIVLISGVMSVSAQKIDSTSYALGVLISQSIEQLHLDKFDAKQMAAGLQDALDKKPKMDMQAAQKFYMDAQKKSTEKAAQIAAEKAKGNKEKGIKFLAENKKRKEVVALPSGLQYEILKAGNGPKPLATDKVKTHYHGTLLDGTVFDSSVQRGEPIEFPLNGVIKGWTEALQLMPTGSKWKLYIPSELAYGDQGAGASIGPGETLIFEVELLEVNPAPAGGHGPGDGHNH